MMIESVEFHNFKALRNTTLPLSHFTLIVGPNSSGKSTGMEAMWAVINPTQLTFDRIVSIGSGAKSETSVEVVLNWGGHYSGVQTRTSWFSNGSISGPRHLSPYNLSDEDKQFLDQTLEAIGYYAPDAIAIASSAPSQSHQRLAWSAANLAVILDHLRGHEPERFEALNQELGRWLPEFDRILFDTSKDGCLSIVLRTREGHHRIQAFDLSQGTLLALALLTLAYIPDPPPIVCIEEPDRGIHPRLLRNVQDALYRLSHPESGRDTRPPVQVIATTHSPYMLDLYRDHPEEIVLAHKVGLEAHFERLSDQSNIDEILEDARLGDLWYSGILGGVPVHP